MPSTRLRAIPVAAALVAFLAASPRTAAGASPCAFDNVERIVAVGDVHGAYDRLLEVLRAAAIVDADGRWIGGRAHLVQLGDVLDRGADSLKVLTFLRELRRDAEAAGGRVHALIGNHEVMRLLGDLRFVAPGEYAAFVTSGSEALRERYVASFPEEQRARVLQDTPLGLIEMVLSFGADRDYGSYLRSLDAVVRINGIVFVHGGISPATAAMPCEVINDTVRRELGADFAATRKAPLQSLAAREDGPLWYRGLANQPDTFAPEVEKILAAQGARAIVVGHTAQPGRMAVRFGRHVFVIDTGMQPAEQLPNGRASALDIRASTFTAIYSDSREVLAGASENTP
jgi:hypothetical protein